MSLNLKSIISLLTIAAVTAAPTAAHAIVPGANGGVSIAGRNMSCGSVATRFDPRLPSPGAAAMGAGLTILNPHLMRRAPGVVQKFVYAHECGHHYVGPSELGADCWAVRRGVREGWLSRRGLDQVCRSFGGAPATASHPSGGSRCANLQRCFGSSGG